MKFLLKYILIISFSSSTCLAYSSSQINNINIYNQQDSQLEEIEIKQPDILQNSNISVDMEPKISNNFIIKEVKLSFYDIKNQEEIRKICSEYVGKTINKNIVLDLERKIIKQLMMQDYLIPQVKVTNNKNILNISLYVLSFDNAVILGDGKNNTLLKQYVKKITSQNPAKVKYTQRYLTLINNLPGFKTHYKLNKTANNETELEVTTKKINIELSSGINNYGINTVGKTQVNGFTQANFTTNGSDSILIRAFTSNYYNRLYDFDIGYNRILNSEGTKVDLLASRLVVNTTKDNEYPANDNVRDIVRGALIHHLYITENQDLEGEFGVTYNNVTINTVDGTTNNSRTDSREIYYYADIGLKYTFQDNTENKSMLSLKYVQNISGNFRKYEDGGVLDPSNEPNRHFNIIKFAAYRDQKLPKNFSLFTHVMANYSGNQLPFFERFTLGSERNFGRAYRFATLTATEMLGASVELRYLHKSEEAKIIEVIEPYLFHDNVYGGKQSNDTITNLSSSGGGLRLKFINNLDFGIEVAVPGRKYYKINGANRETDTTYNFYLNKKIQF